LANQLHEALSPLRARAITCYYSATSSRSVKSNIHAAHRLLLRTRTPVLVFVRVRVHRYVPFYRDTCNTQVRKTEREKEGSEEKEKERKRMHSLLRPLILTEGDGVCTVRGCANGLRCFGGESKTPTTL